MKTPLKTQVKQIAAGVGLGLVVVSPFIWDDIKTELQLSPAPTPLSIQEDDPGWDCVTMGNRVCGPRNSNGVPAGCYDEGGVLVAKWPCYIVVNPAGDADVYYGQSQFDDYVGSDPRDDDPAYDAGAYVGGYN